MWVYACIVIDSLSIGTCTWVLVGKLLRTTYLGFFMADLTSWTMFTFLLSLLFFITN